MPHQLIHTGSQDNRALAIFVEPPLIVEPPPQVAVFWWSVSLGSIVKKTHSESVIGLEGVQDQTLPPGRAFFRIRPQYC